VERFLKAANLKVDSGGKNSVLLAQNIHSLTWAEVSLKNIAHNISEIRKKVGTKRKILAVVKANAYGHGDVEVSKTLVRCGIDMLGIARVEEGARLRGSGVDCPILNFGNILPSQADDIVRIDVHQTVCDLAAARALDHSAKRQHKICKVHIKVDTGMGRIGVLPADTEKFAIRLSRMKNLHVEGIYTHLACADTDRKYTLRQIETFRDVIDNVRVAQIDAGIVHAANSAAIVEAPESYFDMVRPGLIVYGLYPAERMRQKINLKPVLSWKARVVFVKKVSAGTGISYGRTFVTSRGSCIATVAAGYGDGYSGLLSNRGEVILRGRRFPVVGRVCMDQIMVDVAISSLVRPGDIATLIGGPGGVRITAEEIARKIGTISYEVVCGVGSRVPRFYY
jgi:alanine racemase